MRRYSVGQTVRYHDDDEPGEVLEIEKRDDSYWYLVKFADQPEGWDGYWYPQSALRANPD